LPVLPVKPVGRFHSGCPGEACGTLFLSFLPAFSLLRGYDHFLLPLLFFVFQSLLTIRSPGEVSPPGVEVFLSRRLFRGTPIRPFLVPLSCWAFCFFWRWPVSHYLTCAIVGPLSVHFGLCIGPFFCFFSHRLRPFFWPTHHPLCVLSCAGN